MSRNRHEVLRKAVAAAPFEALEQRRMLSASLNLTTHVLTVTGTAGNDFITVTKAPNGFLTNIQVWENSVLTYNSPFLVTHISVSAGDGNDSVAIDSYLPSADIYGGAGDDRLFGGDGDDYLDGWTGNDELHGGAGNDQMLGYTGADWMYGEAGADQLWGESENDVIDGGTGADGISGGAGVDEVTYGSRVNGVMVSLDGVANDGDFNAATLTSIELDNVGTDVENVRGGIGNDRIVSPSTTIMANSFWGGSGNDLLNGGGGNDVLDGGMGSDTSYGQSGDDNCTGGFGTDLLDGGEGNDQLTGSQDNDNLYGGAGADVLNGDGGADRLFGGAGNDAMHGGTQDDLMYGEAGADNLSGDDGNDRLYGGADADACYGGNNDDLIVLVGGNASDHAKGESGFDSFWIDSDSSEVIEDAPLGIDLLNEVINGNVHRIASFQTNSRDDGNHTISETPSKDLLGQNLLDPLAAAGCVYTSNTDKPLFATGGPTMNDIFQNQVGDCWLMATLSATAKANPNHVRQTVCDLGDGTFAVRLWDGSSAKYYRVDSQLPRMNGGLWYANVGAQNAMWVPIIEKAYAFYRDSDGRYEDLSGGWPEEAFNALGQDDVNTDGGGLWGYDAAELANALAGELSAGKAVTFCTDGAPSNGPFVGDHCYAVDHVNRNSAGTITSIVMRNPWGLDGGFGHDGAGGSVDGNDDGWITVTPQQALDAFDEIHSALM